jgi:hypothetical protein
VFVPGPSNTLAPLRWQVIDGLHVTFAEAEVPVPEDLWDLCMASRKSPGVSACLSIIGGDGFTRISRRQWKVSATLIIQRRFPFAMISSHRFTLAMVRAAEWNGANIRAFKWAELDLAFRFLGVPQERWAAVRELAEQLRNGGDPAEVGSRLLSTLERPAPERPGQGRAGNWHESPE